MKEAFEKIKERLEEEAENHRKYWSEFGDEDSFGAMNATFHAQTIVSEVEAEYIKQSTEYINKSTDCSSNWIPCSERLPEEATVYEVTEEIIICSQKQYIVEHRLFGTEGEWLCPSNRKVIAWMPLPEPYKLGDNK